MQASMALKHVASGTDHMPSNFTIKVKFTPVQQNEVKTPFKRTIKGPGRKKAIKVKHV